MNPHQPDADPRTLGQRQELHTLLTSELIAWAESQGWQLRWGEAYRDPRIAQLNAHTGAGIANSLHCQRLAVDLMLFKNGEYITDPLQYKPLADYWLTLDPLCCAGFYFSTVDADHFSVAFRGVM